MKKQKVDVAVIGAGTAGLNASREVKRAGKSFVIIEAGPYGTTCARVGCMPSKLLIAAADAAHGVASAGLFGIEVDDGAWRVNSRAVMERVRRERDRFVRGAVAATERIDEEFRIRGFARFTSTNTLVVDDELEIEFEAAVVATGSTNRIPSSLDAVRDDVLTSDEIFELEELPRSLAVFGTGVVGLELGQALARLGVDVCFFNPFNELGFLHDPHIVSVACDVLRDDLQLNLGVQVHAVRKTDDGKYRVEWSEPTQGPREATFDAVLAATGRSANLTNIGIDKAGVQLDEKGRVTHWGAHTARVEGTRIFVAGDATGFRPILHEASDEGRIAGSNAARYPDSMFGRRHTSMGIAFTDPNMAFVGKRWHELDHDEIAVGAVSFDDQGRSRVMGKNRGALRVYFDSESNLVGAEMFAPAGEHLAHLLAWSIETKLTVAQLTAMPFYHPTIEEGLRTALRDAATNLKILSRCPPEDRSFGPGD